MIISLIVAASENDVIGRDGALPWRLPKDARRFRELTTGHVVVMGRVTYDSIVAALGRPLPDRASIVVTRASQPPGSEGARQPGPGGPGAAGTPPSGGQVLWAGSLASALDEARRVAAAAGDEELFVAGGVSIYCDVLPLADRIYLTRVHHVVEGDRSMPPGWLAGFDLVRREDVTDPKSQLKYSFLDYERAPA
jgi:dihydrofolate reductase